MPDMQSFSTSQAARQLGIGIRTLSRYIAEKKVPSPKIMNVGGNTIHIWTEAEIEHARKLLPKIANGRKTRHQKQKGKTQKPQPGAAVPHKTKKSRPAQQSRGSTGHPEKGKPTERRN